jgi:hypothetical protein
MNNKQRATLRRVFHSPTPANIAWDDVLSLLAALGATIEQGRGSRIRVTLHGVDSVMHEPHPRRQTKRAVVRSIRTYRERAGIQP